VANQPKREITLGLISDTHAKIAAMTDAEREARVQEIYDTPSSELTPADNAEFFAIMFGGKG